MKKIILSFLVLSFSLAAMAIDPETDWTKVAPYDTQWSTDGATHELSFTGTAPTTGTKGAISTYFNDLVLNPSNTTLNEYKGLKLTFDAYVSGTSGNVTSVILGWTSSNNKGCHIQIDKDKIQVVGITGTTITTVISDGSYSANVNQNAYNSFEINIASDGLSFTVKMNSYTCPTTLTSTNNANAIARLTAGKAPAAFCSTFTTFKLRNFVASRLGIVKEYYTYTTPITMNGDWWPQIGQNTTPPAINGWFNNGANSSLNFEGTIITGTRIATTFGSIGAPYTGLNLKFDATIDPNGNNTMIILGSDANWGGQGIVLNISKYQVQILKNFDYGNTTMMSSDIATYQALLAGGGVRSCEINVSATGLVTVKVAGYLCPTSYQADVNVLANPFAMVCPAVTGFTMKNILAKKGATAKSYFPTYSYAISASSNNGAMGGVSGAGTFDKSSDVTLVATATTCNRFVNWTESGVEVSPSASYTLTNISAAHTLVANFEADPTANASISSQSTATQTTNLAGNFTAITVTASGANLNYQWYSNTSASNSGGSSLGTSNGAQTNSYTPQHNVAGTKYYYCVVTGACSAATSAVSGAFITISTYNISGGSTNVSTLPVCSTCDLTVANDGVLVFDQTRTYNNITVAGGGKVTLNSGYNLTASNFTLNSHSTNGAATFVDENSTGGLSVSGTTSVNQHLTSGRNWYISSPVTGATSNTFNAANPSNIVYWYDEAHGTSAPWPQITDNATGLSLMKGYVVNMLADGDVTFNGALNTGSKSTTIYRTAGQTKEGFNLVGNPYASYLDWEQISKTNLLTTVWYRVKNVSDAYTFDTYNADGQIGTANNGGQVNNHIPPMQAFWVRVNGASQATLTVNNSMRTHKGNQNTGLGTVNDGIFKVKALNQSILRLEVSNGTSSDETIIYSNPGASNDYDNYDSPKMFNNSASIAEIYTIAGTEQLAINGLNSVQYDTEIPLGFSTSNSGDLSYSLKASLFSNFDAGTRIILKDNQDVNNPIVTDLSDGGVYSFTSSATNNNTSRFTLIFKAPSVATGLNSSGNGNVWISTNANNQIVINGTPNTDTSVTIYNAIGQKMYGKQLNSTNNVIETPFQSGVYMVCVNNAGKCVINKISIK